MAVLTQEILRNRIFEPRIEKRLVISPLLDERQISQASIDLRLGSEFITIRNTNIPAIDPTKREEIRRNLGQYQEKVRIGFDEPFVLHPSQFVLGCTFEYICVPGDLTAQVAGRSSWGRLGLLIEAAPNISPGFRGCITLELINAGLAPLVLYPLMIVSQLVVLENVNAVTYEGRYRFPIGPEFSRLHEDTEMQFLADAENFR